MFQNAISQAADVPLVEFMDLVFTHVLGESYCRWPGSLLLCLCDVFQMLINSPVCWFLFQILFLFFSQEPPLGCCSPQRHVLWASPHAWTVPAAWLLSVLLAPPHWSLGTSTAAGGIKQSTCKVQAHGQTQSKSTFHLSHSESYSVFGPDTAIETES